MRIFVVLSYLFFFLSSLSNNAFAAENTYTASKKFEYGLDLSLLMMDALKPPSIGPSATFQAAPSAPSDEGINRRARGFGLEYAKFLGRWTLGPTAYLELGLRPDALTRRSDLDSPPATREFDTRAGNDLAQKPRLSLLDTYGLYLKRGASFGLSMGVFSELIKRRISYPEVLEFGLTVPFPAKFSAAKVSLDKPLSTDARSGPTSRVFAEAVVYQGDEDRAEFLDTEANRSYDHGTIVTDPYQGAAGYFGWAVDSHLELGCLVGGGDTAIQDGKKNDFLLQGVVSYAVEDGGLPFRVQFDGRVKRQKWNVPTSPRVPLEQRSFSLTSALLVAAQTSWLMGFHQGLMQRHSSLDQGQTSSTSGYQFETGALYDFGDGLRLTGLMAQERREFNEDGAKTGAFGTKTDPALVIRRFAIEVNYFFHDGGFQR